MRAAIKERLFDPARFKGEIFYSERATFSRIFSSKFRARYGREPILNSDIGYYAVHLMSLAFEAKGNPVERLKKGGLKVDGIEFYFDENNVYRGLKQELRGTRTVE